MKNRIATWLAACLVFGAPASALGLASAVAERAAMPSDSSMNGAGANDAAQGSLRFPRPTGRDLPLIAHVLELDADQRVIVEAFVDVAALGEDGFAAGHSFYTDLSAVLSDAQRASLPRLCDELRRDHMQSTSVVEGENLEVGALLREAVGVEARTRLDGMISEYRTELDVLVSRRSRLTAERAKESDIQTVRVRIRDAHSGALERISAALSSDDAYRLREAALAKGFPVAASPVEIVAQLRTLCGELPERELLELLAQADPRAREIRDDAVAAVRARDEARASENAVSTKSAAAAIASAEQAIDGFQRWIYPQIVTIATEANLAKSLTGRAILAQSKRLADTAAHDWNDQQATLSVYDRDGDGALSDDESAVMMRDFAKGVGKSTRVRL